jgi:hypothetical protein
MTETLNHDVIVCMNGLDKKGGRYYIIELIQLLLT